MLLTMAIAAQVAASNPMASEPLSAEVTHQGSTWQIDYMLRHDAPAWVFPSLRLSCWIIGLGGKGIGRW